MSDIRDGTSINLGVDFSSGKRIGVVLTVRHRTGHRVDHVTVLPTVGEGAAVSGASSVVEVKRPHLLVLAKDANVKNVGHGFGVVESTSSDVHGTGFIEGALRRKMGARAR